MEDKDTILTFDTLYTTNEIQILKLALPLLSASLRPFAALIIKGKELKYCLDQLPKGKIENASLEMQYLDVFLEHAIPYCTPRQRELFLQLKNIKKSLDMFEQMRNMMDLFGEDGMADFGNMFQIFGAMNETPDTENVTHTPGPDSAGPDSAGSGSVGSAQNSFLNQFIQNSLSGEQTEMFEKFKRQFESDSGENT